MAARSWSDKYRILYANIGDRILLKKTPRNTKSLPGCTWVQYVIIEINQRVFNDLKLKHLLNQALRRYENK